MGVKLVSSGGGSVEINPPATASSFIATMPAGTGNVVVNGVNGALVAATAIASTSGTSIDFTGIPSWVRRITVIFSDVSTNGTSPIIVQIGDAGGIENTGYGCAIAFTGPSTGSATGSTAGFPFSNNAAASVMSGQMVIANLTANTWVYTAAAVRTNDGFVFTSGGSKTLSPGVLDRVRVTTVNGTDAFDAGTINIMYE